MAPAVSAQASELGVSISENTLPIEENTEQDNQDQEIFDTISDNSISDNSITEEELGSSDNKDTTIIYEYDISPLADYDTYYGSISTTYVEYMRGYLSKLEPDQHYVGARTGQYEYIFAFGDINYSNGNFSGNDINVITWNTQNTGYFNSSIQSNFSLSVGNYLVYTDLGYDYPSLATSSDISLRQIVYAAAITISFYTLGFMTKRSSTRIRNRRWRGW